MKKPKYILILILNIIICMESSNAQSPITSDTNSNNSNMAHLEVGDVAPQFTAKNQNGKEIKLSNLKGKKVILYFYPKDDTPGCTAEACNLRDNYKLLTEKGFEVIGVSPDPVKSHTKFIDKYNLQFNLLADTDKLIIKSYGAWGLKKLYGKEYEGLLRTTYVIDEAGLILKVITKVNTGAHTQQILDELEMQ